MSKIYTMGPEKTFTPLPTGEYVLTLKEWKEVTEDKDSQYSKKGDVKIQFTWAVTVPGDDDAERRVSVAPPEGYNKKSTLCHIGVALGVIDAVKAAAEGLSYNPDQWVGRKCMGTILRQPKQDDPKTMTDKISAYSPLPANTFVPSPIGDVSLSAPAVDELTARFLQLLAFDEGEASELPAGLTRAQIVKRMRDLGALPLSDAGNRTLADERDVASMMGVALPEELNYEPATVREGLLQLDAIKKLSGA